jgi:hypothetical protein
MAVLASLGLLWVAGCSAGRLFPSLSKSYPTKPASQASPTLEGSPTRSTLFVAQAKPRELKTEFVSNSGIKLRLEPKSEEKVHWWRSTAPDSREIVEDSSFPLVDLGTSLNGEFLDPRPPQGVTCRYWVTAADTRQILGLAKLEIPARPLAKLRHCRLEIDKSRYLLSVIDLSTQTSVKDYAVVFGRKRRQRKLQRDNSSTPEGIYRISNLQPQATFHRAYDIDYPNAVDRARYQLLPHEADLGGEIQIHGRGIHTNWTFGCVALRDEDIDELFGSMAIGTGCSVWIYGGELSRSDLVAASKTDPNRPDWSPLELGAWQLKNHLPPTCLWDVESCKHSHF